MESTPAGAGRKLKPPKTIGQKCLASFLVRCRTTRGGPYFSDAELRAVLDWTHETLDCCEALSRYPAGRDLNRAVRETRDRLCVLNAILVGSLIVDLVGARLIFVSPTPEESAELAAWGLKADAPNGHSSTKPTKPTH